MATLSTHTKNIYGQYVQIYNNELVGLVVLPLFSTSSLMHTLGGDPKKIDRQQSFRFGMSFVKNKRPNGSGKFEDLAAKDILPIEKQGLDTRK